jgi:hypothetical protein
LATAADTSFEAIVSGDLIEYGRTEVLVIFLQLKRKIADDLAIIEG